MADTLDQRKDPPEGIRVLSNGAWQDKKTGRIVKAAPGQAWDSEQASKMAKRRHELVKQRTRDAIRKAMDVAEDPGDVLKAFPKAHGMVIEELMRDVVLNGEERGKTRVDAYKTILNMEGSIKPEVAVQEGGLGEGMTIHFSKDVTKSMMKTLAEHNARD